MTFFDIVGLLGVAAIILSYMLLQAEILKPNQPIYSVLNLMGALLILFSLFFNWNLSSVVIEIFWILISIFGLARAVHKRKTN